VTDEDGEYTIWFTDGTEITLKDSKTPLITIGENGNWYINNVDSGKTSKGADGANGSKVTIGENEGYINTIDAAATVAETVEEVVIDASELLREEIVNCGMGFVGNRYVWGGIDPHKGADCSGFTMYIMREVAGVTLSHSSRAQGNEGRVISAEEMRPGDLVFYGSGKRINHVAIYAGDGMIVHASNEEDGIKVSPWNYRKPIKIVNVLGD
jgi:cell wall-associated NlpC family hydrolase